MNLNQACGLNYGTCKHGRPLTQGCFECAQEKLPLAGDTERLLQIGELQAQLRAWEELWRTIKEMEPKLGDLNKPLAIAASYALLVQERDRLVEALYKIAEVCNGYGNEAGWACQHARAILAKFDQ